MRVFKISGKVESCTLWSDREADYIGYFIQEDGTDEIKGYVKEQYKTQFDSTRYIKGFYVEDKKQLMFMKFSTEIRLRPLAYVFHNIENNGLWSNYQRGKGCFFPGGTPHGLATVQLEEILEGEEKNRLIWKTWDIFRTKCELEHNPILNIELMEQAQELKEFVNENSPFYLKPAN